MLEEMENIKYGNLETAMEYCKRNRTEEWIQQFLRCDGHNVALADGLLIEERFYTGIVQFDITLLHNIKEGAPEYLSKKDDIGIHHHLLLSLEVTMVFMYAMEDIDWKCLDKRM